MFLSETQIQNPSIGSYTSKYGKRFFRGKFPAYFKLPSIRDLSDELAISRNTVEGAFQELSAEGCIYSKSRSGYFVSDIEFADYAAIRFVHPAGKPQI